MRRQQNTVCWWSERGFQIISASMVVKTVGKQKEGWRTDGEFNITPFLWSQKRYSEAPSPNVEQKIPLCVGGEKKKQSSRAAEQETGSPFYF